MHCSVFCVAVVDIAIALLKAEAFLCISECCCSFELFKNPGPGRSNILLTFSAHEDSSLHPERRRFVRAMFRASARLTATHLKAP